MAIKIGSSTNLSILTTTATATIDGLGGGATKRPPPVIVSTNPRHVNIDTLSKLYFSCNHSPHRFPSAAAGDVDPSRIAVALAHSSVVVSVFGGGGSDDERDRKGLFGRILPAVVRVSPESGRLVGFGRAVSDLGLTASIHDVMVIPSLRGMGFGRMIVQRLIRMLNNRGHL